MESSYTLFRTILYQCQELWMILFTLKSEHWLTYELCTSLQLSTNVFFNTGDVLRLERYLSKQYVLLSTQTTVQDAVTQLRATERDKYFTFILDMACYGSRVILEEVKTRILDKIVTTDRYFRIPIWSALEVSNHNAMKHVTNVNFSQPFSPTNLQVINAHVISRFHM